MEFFTNSTAFFMENRRFIPERGLSLFHFGRMDLKDTLKRVCTPCATIPSKRAKSNRGSAHFKNTDSVTKTRLAESISSEDRAAPSMTQVI